MKVSCAILILATADASSIRGRRNTLQLVGYGGEPNRNRFPLGPCEGDCDNDDECAEGLVCFQREIPGPGESWMEVPGCIGGADFTAGTDFCIFDPALAEERPATDAPTFAPTTLSPTFEPTLTPTSPQPTETGDTGAPTFPVTDMPSMVPSSSDYWDLPEINYVGDNGNPSGIPLGICEGDCDVDDDCLDELVCFQRNADEDVPGCRGKTRNTMDYCITPLPEESIELPIALITMSPTMSETAAATEMIVALESVGDNTGMVLGLCQGDCDVDSDCLDDLICFQRDNLEEVPGCAGSGSRSFDYCIIDPNPSTFSPTEMETTIMTGAPTIAPTIAPTEPQIAVAAEEASILEPTMTPTMEPMLVTVDKYRDGLLGLCEGKCKEDDDCEGDLICMERDEEDEVPGCAGVPHRGDDYCINP